MPTIRTFRALRYDSARVGDLSAVIAPPYDVIDPDEQEQLYTASPYNMVRLILGKQYSSDTAEDNRYIRAQRDFVAWRGSHVFSQDPTAALYLVEHAFDDGGSRRVRLGFMALLELLDPIERSVYRHEATLAAPKEDRTKLLAALPANLEPIFCIYPDERGTIQTILAAYAQGHPPTAQATLNDDVIRLWAVTDPSLNHAITHSLSSVAVLIADGHHRFEVAYANRSRYGAVMTYFVSMEDPGLLVRPIHRVVQHAGPLELQRLQGLCTMERAQDLASVIHWLEDFEDFRGRFGCYDGQALYRVEVKQDRLARWLMAPPVPLPLATLDVSLLHGLILPSLHVNGAGVRYPANASQALEAVDCGGQGSSAWLLRGISLKHIYTLASQGFILPPKSTYFYPKVPSGLVINPL